MIGELSGIFRCAGHPHLYLFMYIGSYIWMYVVFLKSYDILAGDHYITDQFGLQMITIIHTTVLEK
jgi:hypothetical protein